jgi:hypothetical protein
MDNWGAFLFFAGWCFISLVYVFVAVPETAGLSLEHIDALFEGPFWQMNSKARMNRKMTGVIVSPGSDDASIEDVEVGRSGKAGET